MKFDIKVPYTTRPSMVRNDGVLFSKTPRIEYIEQKRKELSLLGSKLYAENESSVKLLERASSLCGLPTYSNIVDFALQFEEDVAIMSNGKLSAICFCFPSSWKPCEGLNKTLTEIHSPVADGDHLRNASQRLAMTMADVVLGSFKRQVWTITVDSKLSNHPERKCIKTPKSIEDLYFRVETQTTNPLGDGISSIFFVKVDVIPLIEIWDEYGDIVKQSLLSMSDNIIEYKNLRKIKSILCPE